MQVISSAPWFEAHVPRVWQAPLVGVSVANAVLFWIFACTLFIDGFQPRRWHALAWTGAAMLGFWNCVFLLGSSHVLAPVSVPLQRLVAPVCALLAAWAAVAHWRADLVERRRRVRGFLVVTGVVHTLVQVGFRIASPDGRLYGVVALTDVMMLLVIAWAAAWYPLTVTAPMAPGAQPDATAVLRIDDPGAAPDPASSIPQPVADIRTDPAQERLAAALAHAMEQQHLYSSEDLTVTRLAARLEVPEYRLRRLINQRLGHRNFNAFVNGYRLAAARKALADPTQAHLPILSIALASGFQSIGPFNRAFKAQTGHTPSEFRARNMADSGIGQPEPAA